MRQASRVFLALLLLWAPLAKGEEAVFQARSYPVAVEADLLRKELVDRLSRVVEFRELRRLAKQQGVRVWLFGGTASAYAHYVHWDLLREKGDTRYQADRFDYDYTNIFRSTQDLDIVVDGNAAKAAEFQKLLQAKFPYLRGQKSTWEVRSLKEGTSEKLALLANPDFLNQHTDSNSTGMIEISQPVAGESAVRDLRDWDAKGDTRFFQDIFQHRLTFYYSDTHMTTSRAKAGLNPPLFSIMRYLTKVFQYELDVAPEDAARIRELLSKEPDLNKYASVQYVRDWVAKNGMKLLQSAVNLEYAWNVLEGLGLRKRLVDFKYTGAGQVTPLGLWMSKEPLRMKPIGQGTGKTARQLGITVVAHETQDYLAFESITRAHTGDPNVLISRRNAQGETAAYGDGFYTRKGRVGARGTGITIRFTVDPNAREGSDFTVSGDYLIFTNKAALKVQAESLIFSPIEYLEMVAGGLQFDINDKGQVEKLTRRVRYRSTIMTPEEREYIVSLVAPEARKKGAQTNLLMEWFKLPVSADYPEIMRDYLYVNFDGDRRLATEVFTQAHWAKHPEVLIDLIRRGNASSDIFSTTLAAPHWAANEAFMGLLADSGLADAQLLSGPLAGSEWVEKPEFLRAVIARGQADQAIADNILTKPHWAARPEVLVEFARHGVAKDKGPIVLKLLSHAVWLPQRDALLEAIIRTTSLDAYLAREYFAKQDLAQNLHLIVALIDNGEAVREVAQHVLTRPESRNFPWLLEKLILAGGATDAINEYVLTQTFWANNPRITRLTQGAKPTVAILKEALAKGQHIGPTPPKACGPELAGMKAAG